MIDHLPRIRRALLRWHSRDGMHAPWRESGDPYAVMVAAVMAQQTQMSRVIPSFERFVAAYPTIEALAGAPAGDVIRVWAGMGYNQRAVRLHRAAQTVVAHGWPQDAASLALIDGIGPFTAAIIASFSFGQAAACVDTNVRRVLGRLAGEETIDGRRLQALADRALAMSEPARWNQALMDYGARVCVPRPRCGECVVATWCASRDRFSGNGDATAIPVAEPADAILRVAEERVTYGATQPRAHSTPKRKQPQVPFERSTRYYRGRIIDVLRALAPGETIAVRSLRSRIAGGEASPDIAALRAWLTALEAAGLVVLVRGRVSLPE